MSLASGAVFRYQKMWYSMLFVDSIMFDSPTGDIHIFIALIMEIETTVGIDNVSLIIIVDTNSVEYLVSSISFAICCRALVPASGHGKQIKAKHVVDIIIMRC